MKFKVLLLLLLSINLLASVDEVESLKYFFAKISHDLEGVQEVMDDRLFNNQWSGSKDISDEIKFKKNNEYLCLQLRKKQIALYFSKDRLKCITDDGYMMKITNYSFRGSKEKIFENSIIHSLEFNSLSKYYYFPLVNLRLDKKIKKFDVNLPLSLIKGVEILK